MPRSRSRLTPRAQSFRKARNGSEDSLWHALRNRQLDGRKFRRQFPIGPYIADFVCVDSRLVVELDGSQHLDDPADDMRNYYMNRLGWSVARFPSGGILKSRGAILDTIAAVCDGHIREFVRDPEFQFYPAISPATPHPNPLPLKRERE